MNCRITDMHNKEVINICDGCCLGCVDDVEIDTCTAQLVAIVINGRPKWFGILGHEDDIVIGWHNIEVIGEDSILVRYECSCCDHPHHRHGILSSLFGR